MADCAPRRRLYYANLVDAVRPTRTGNARVYLRRLIGTPSFARVVEEDEAIPRALPIENRCPTGERQCKRSDAASEEPRP